MIMVQDAMPTAPYVAASTELGVAEGRCHADEKGPAILVTAVGLKSRDGELRAELYPPEQEDFLKDDKRLVQEGKTFRRVVATVPASGPVRICIRVPHPGTYTLALIHNLDKRPKFNLWKDGIGFPGDPKIGLGAPPAAESRITAGAGITQVSIRLNYRRGLFSFGPIN